MNLEDKLDAVTKQFEASASQLDKRAAETERQHREALEEFAASMLKLSNDEAVQKAKRSKLWTGILSSIAVIAMAFAGYVTTMLATAKPGPEVKEAADKVEATTTEIGNRIEAVEKQLDQNDQIHERIVEIQLQQQVQLSDSTDYLSDKIDKISGRAASVKEPESMTNGRERAKKIKAKGERPAFDPADPLADLKK